MRRRYLRNRSDRISYPGLIAAWSAKGKTNEDVDRNVLKDLTGNGHDITLNNFAYSGMSGYGRYQSDFNTWVSIPSRFEGTIESHKFIITKSKEVLHAFVYNEKKDEKTTYKITGLLEGQSIIFGSDNPTYTLLEVTEDGIYEVDWTKLQYLRCIMCNFIGECTITVEIIPEYPDALVFDGVDDGGVAEINEPKLANGYTFIIEREIIKFNPFSCVALFQEGDDDFSPFGIEQLFNSTYYTWNYNSSTNINNIIKLEKSISYQTDKTYNNFIINKGSIPIRSKFNIGSWDNRYCVNMAFYSAYLFNRTLTDEEIKSFIRKHIDPEYLLPSEIPTPNVYYDFTNGDNSKGEANNVIKDLSGNSNDATAHNFVWNEESGYAGGGLKFDGVDDYIATSNTKNVIFNTIIAVLNPKNLYKTYIDCRPSSVVYMYGQVNEIAYNNFNKTNGKTYLNGKLNTTIRPNDGIFNKKHCVALVNPVVNNSTKTTDVGMVLGTNYAKTNFTNSIFYKVLAFADSLTEEQIKAVINKYNLLDGVDNIDVN